MRTNIVLDDDLVTEAFKYSNAKTKRQLVREALQAFVSERSRMDLRELKSSGGISPDYDYKAMRTAEP